MTMSPTVRLLADDLTGALDTAAELVRLTGPIQVFWHGAIPSQLPANAAFDSGTRELSSVDAAALATGLARLMDGADIAYKKIDSLLRGPTLAEIAAFLRAGPWSTACSRRPSLIRAAPREADASTHATRRAAGPTSAATLSRLCARWVSRRLRATSAKSCRPGVCVFDAETDDDLRAVAETARRAPRTVLWCGSGGLAQALARELHAGIWPMACFRGTPRRRTERRCRARSSACSARTSGRPRRNSRRAALTGSGFRIATSPTRRRWLGVCTKTAWRWRVSICRPA